MDHSNDKLLTRFRSFNLGVERAGLDYVDPRAPSWGCMPLLNCPIVVGVFCRSPKSSQPQSSSCDHPSASRTTNSPVGESILICFRPGTGAIPHFSVWSDSPSPLPASIHCNSWSAISASTKLSNHSWGVLSVSHKFTTTILDHPSASRTTNIVS